MITLQQGLEKLLQEGKNWLQLYDQLWVAKKMEYLERQRKMQQLVQRLERTILIYNSPKLSKEDYQAAVDKVIALVKLYEVGLLYFDEQPVP